MKYIKVIHHKSNIITSGVLFVVFEFFLVYSMAFANTNQQNNIDYMQLCASESDEVLVIRKPADFSGVNRNTKRIICVTPGDYRSRGTIIIMSSGTKELPRYLVYYDPELLQTEAVKHPVYQQQKKRVILSGLRFNYAKHWVVDGISLKPVSGKSGSLINFPAGLAARSVTLKNLLIEGGGGGAGQIYIGSTNNNITIVGNVLRNSKPIAKKDSHCIKINAAKNIIISQNEIYNCAGDGIQVSHDGSPGTKIMNNDIYITTDLYSDCKGTLTTKGACACAENAIDIKGATAADEPAPSSEWLMISDNRMWGFKRTDISCGGTGDAGSAIVIHYDPSDYIMIENNVIHHSQHGITVSTHNKGLSSDGTDHVSIINNTIYSIHNPDNKGSALNLGKAFRYEVYFNTIIETDRYLTMGKKPGAWNEFRCNVLIDAGYSLGEWHSTSIVDRNAYFNTTIIQSDNNDLYFSDAKLSQNTELCFVQRRLTAGETLCVPYAVTTDMSPHKKQCTPKNTILRHGIGVDNRALSEYFLN